MTPPGPGELLPVGGATNLATLQPDATLKPTVVTEPKKTPAPASEGRKDKINLGPQERLGNANKTESVVLKSHEEQQIVDVLLERFQTVTEADGELSKWDFATRETLVQLGIKSGVINPESADWNDLLNNHDRASNKTLARRLMDNATRLTFSSYDVTKPQDFDALQHHRAAMQGILHATYDEIALSMGEKGVWDRQTNTWRKIANAPKNIWQTIRASRGARISAYEEKYVSLAGSYQSEEFTFANALEGDRKALERCRNKVIAAQRILTSKITGQDVQVSFATRLTELSVNVANNQELSTHDRLFLGAVRKRLIDRKIEVPSGDWKYVVEAANKYASSDMKEWRRLCVEANKDTYQIQGGVVAERITTQGEEVTDEAVAQRKEIGRKKQAHEAELAKKTKGADQAKHEREEGVTYLTTEANLDSMDASLAAWTDAKNIEARDSSQIIKNRDTETIRRGHAEKRKNELAAAQAAGVSSPEFKREKDLYINSKTTYDNRGNVLIPRVTDDEFLVLLTQMVNQQEVAIATIDTKIAGYNADEQKLKDAADTAWRKYAKQHDLTARHFRHAVKGAKYDDEAEEKDILPTDIFSTIHNEEVVDSAKVRRFIDLATHYHATHESVDPKDIAELKKKIKGIEEVDKALHARPDIAEELVRTPGQAALLSSAEDFRQLARLTAATATDGRVTEFVAQALGVSIPDRGALESKKAVKRGKDKGKNVDNEEYVQLWETISQRLHEANDIDLVRNIVIAIQNDRVQAIIKTGDPKSEKHPVAFQVPEDRLEIFDRGRQERQLQESYERNRKADTRLAALRQEGVLPGINTTGTFVEAKGETYFVSDRVYRLEEHDGSYSLEKLSDVLGLTEHQDGTIAFATGSSTRYRDIQDDLFVEIGIALQSYDDTHDRGGSRPPSVDLRRQDATALATNPEVDKNIREAELAEVAALPGRREALRLRGARAALELSRRAKELAGVSAAGAEFAKGTTKTEPKDFDAEKPPTQMTWTDPDNPNMRVEVQFGAEGVTLTGLYASPSGEFVPTDIFHQQGDADYKPDGRITVSDFFQQDGDARVTRMQWELPAATFDFAMQLSPEQRQALEIHSSILTVSGAGSAQQEMEVFVDASGELAVRNRTERTLNTSLLTYFNEQAVAGNTETIAQIRAAMGIQVWEAMSRLQEPQAERPAPTLETPHRADFLQAAKGEVSLHRGERLLEVDTIDPQDPPDRIIWEHHNPAVRNDFRVVISVGDKIRVTGQNKDAALGTWQDSPAMAGSGRNGLTMTELETLDQRDPNVDAFARRIPAAVFDAFAEMPAELRKQLDIGRVQVSMNGMDCEIFVTEAGAIGIKNATKADNTAITWSEFMQADVDRTSPLTVFDLADPSSPSQVMVNEVLATESAVGKKVLEVMQRRIQTKRSAERQYTADTVSVPEEDEIYIRAGYPAEVMTSEPIIINDQQYVYGPEGFVKLIQQPDGTVGVQRAFRTDFSVQGIAAGGPFVDVAPESTGQWPRFTPRNPLSNTHLGHLPGVHGTLRPFNLRADWPQPRWPGFTPRSPVDVTRPGRLPRIAPRSPVDVTQAPELPDISRELEVSRYERFVREVGVKQLQDLPPNGSRTIVEPGGRTFTVTRQEDGTLLAGDGAGVWRPLDEVRQSRTDGLVFESALFQYGGAHLEAIQEANRAMEQLHLRKGEALLTKEGSGVVTEFDPEHPPDQILIQEYDAAGALDNDHRTVISLASADITIRKQERNAGTQTWQDVATLFPDGVPNGATWERFSGITNANDPDALRMRMAGAVFDQFARLDPAARSELSMQPVDVGDVRISVNREGQMIVEDNAHPDVQPQALSDCLFQKTVMEGRVEYRRTASGTEIQQNPIMQIEEAVAREFVRVLHDRARRP